MSTAEKSIAHRGEMNIVGAEMWADGLVPWRAQEPPVWPPATPESKGRMTGRLRRCSYCGSMHPADVAAAIKAGAKGHFADRKYGWPHKLYFDGVPNPFAGMLESLTSKTTATEDEIASGEFIRVLAGYHTATGEPYYAYCHKGTPARATTYEKFYTVHLQDATPEDRAVIEEHICISLTFENGRVSWKPFTK